MTSSLGGLWLQLSGRFAAEQVRQAARQILPWQCLEPSAEGNGNASRLFTDDQQDGVGLLAQAQGRAVPHAEMRHRILWRLSEWQLASGRTDAPVADDDGAVVQGAARAEQIADQSGADLGVDPF